MTAFHTIILFSDGAPLTPAGGSSCSLYNDNNESKDKLSKQIFEGLLAELENIFIQPGHKSDETH